MNLVGMGLGVTLIPGYMNNLIPGRLFFVPLPEMCLPLLYDGVEERGDEAGITRFHRHCAERLASVTA